jgi:hypothetical protein
MDHLLVHATPSRIVAMRAHGEILVSEFTPNADHFDAFGFVGVNEKVIVHLNRPAEFDNTAAMPAMVHAYSHPTRLSMRSRVIRITSGRMYRNE